MHPEAVSGARPCLGTSPVASPPTGRGAFRQQRAIECPQPMRMKRWYAGFGKLCAGCPFAHRVHRSPLRSAAGAY